MKLSQIITITDFDKTRWIEISLHRSLQFFLRVGELTERCWSTCRPSWSEIDSEWRGRRSPCSWPAVPGAPVPSRRSRSGSCPSCFGGCIGNQSAANKKKREGLNAQTTDMNLGQAQCLASWAPTSDLWLEITRSRKFVIQVFTWITKFLSQVPTSLQAKMARQGKQMRVGAREGCAYHSVRLVLLVDNNEYEVDFNLSGKPLQVFIHSEHSPVPILTFFGTHSYL